MLCGELIYENDIKVCRRNVKEKFIRDLQIDFEQHYGL